MRRYILGISIVVIGIFLFAVMFISTNRQDHVYGDETPNEGGAEVNIQAPAKVKIGDLIILDLSESIGTGFDYKVEPVPPGLQTFNDGRVIICGTGNKNVTYTFMVSCALDNDSDIGIHKIKVTGSQAPGPPPEPGKNIVAKVKDWVVDVKAPNKRIDAIRLAQSFASVAIIIEQDMFNTPAELVQATSTSNRDALGTNIENWKPLLDSLMQELKAMAKLGKLSTVKDHAQVWKEVAQGLREYAETLE